MPEQPARLFGIGNTSRQQNEMAEKAAKDFKGLPEGVSHWDVLSLLKRARLAMNLTGALISYLEFLMGFTRLQDWQSGSSPIVYLTVSATASRRGISERQVLNIERALNALGLLCWHDSGNKRRYGHRSPSGELKEAYGVNLAPLAALYDRLLDLVEGQEQRALIWKQEKAVVQIHKRVLRERLTLNPSHAAADQVMSLLKSLPKRIEARVTITQLVQWSQQMKALIEAFEKPAAPEGEAASNETSAAHPCEVEPKPMKDQKSALGGKKTPGRSELKFRHINTNNTKQTLSNERSNRRALPHGNDLKVLLAANAEMAFEKVARESTAPAGQHLKELEGMSARGPLPSPLSPSGQETFCNSGIEHITLKQVLACASPMLRDMIRNASKTGGADWAAVVEAAKLAAGYLGISAPAWQDARDRLGASAAATIVVIAERRSTDPKTTINSYGGFVRGCVAKAQVGDLHLHKSVFGLLGKGNLDE
ncbi:plasmid replication protein RepC [Pseudovibrio sp. Tun.PSC04-5.I4]|uniref:plasmid replication protein RepC n=1 Tax=Pseudovibrio sp. Tun.PSC04-5.I4 TaxID=1798213 RepID=UPI0013565AD0|nr:plasmid replication protein RepC [Pseudovibrio sp. Tun.PSC04-5.I4]